MLKHCCKAKQSFTVNFGGCGAFFGIVASRPDQHSSVDDGRASLANTLRIEDSKGSAGSMAGAEDQVPADLAHVERLLSQQGTSSSGQFEQTKKRQKRTQSRPSDRHSPKSRYEEKPRSSRSSSAGAKRHHTQGRASLKDQAYSPLALNGPFKSYAGLECSQTVLEYTTIKLWYAACCLFASSWVVSRS